MLTSGQMRVSIPNRSSALHCGELIKRRKAVCLFGAPDPIETDKLYHEQMTLNRVDFLQKWNFDIVTGLPSSQSIGLRWDDNHIDNRTCVDIRGANEGDNCNNSLLEEIVTDCITNEEVQHKDATQTRSLCNGVRTGRVQRCRSSQGRQQMKITDFWPKKKCNQL